MRDINFRCWDQVEKQWVNSEYFYRADELYPRKAPHIMTLMCDARYDHEPPVTVQLSTRLHDKNGREIFEGDLMVLDDGDVPIIISWNKDHAGFAMTGSDESYQGTHQSILKKYTVVGNIFENPELLEES